MQIQFEGRTWEFDEDHITVQQAMAMHLAYGFTLQGWFEGVRDMDPRAWQCTYWLMLQQNGETKAIKDCEFPFVAFMTAYTEAQAAEKPAAPEPDPTSPSPADGAPASPTSGTQPDMTQTPPAFAPSTVS